ncbi:MAG: type II/IV secretion system ATPase subunit, partial [Candidatus Methanoperedens sp.]|nr:type II/IV secretion system ATPase subunit [Candidatus Methanoperedens sp.]
MIKLKISDKITGFIKLLQDVIKEVRVVDGRVKEIPMYDESMYGEIVTFVPPVDFEVVEQSWIMKPFVLVTIMNKRAIHKNIYYVSEPALDNFENELFIRIIENLKIFLLDNEINMESMDKELILYNNYIKFLNIYGIKLETRSMYKIWYYIRRVYVGYDKLDALVKDPMIEDISCVGYDTPVYLYHRKYINIETNIVFKEEELNSMIMKLAQLCGKSISTGYPIMNARLPDGSRLEATLGREVTTRGGTITIRKFRELPFTPPDLVKYGTFNTEVIAYLWLAVENNKSAIFVGATAAGKTTTLNAISLFIPSESKVITIEDTREITLYHRNWIPGVVRDTFMGQEAAAIDMFELLRSALRQRPEYLIVGEVRGKEAYTLFQAMNTGHTTYSTMHADSIQAAVNRLLNEPINVPLMMLSSLDIMTVQVLKYVGGRRVRRLESLSELVGIDPSSGNISIRDIYTWNPSNDTIERSGSSRVLEEIMLSRGWSREKINKEL